MEDSNQKYNELVGLIKAKTPTLENSQDFTAEILSAVDRLKNKSVKNRLKYVSWVSSVAATLLLGLFLLEISKPIESNVSNHNFYSLIDFKDATLTEINHIVREKQEYRKKREFYMSIKTINPF